MQERPDPVSLWVLGAYQLLRASRTIGMTIGPIPLSEVAAYCDFAGIGCPIQRTRLARFVMALDRAEREHGNS